MMLVDKQVEDAWSPGKFIEDECPNLFQRMNQDADAGDFDWRWGLTGIENENYLSGLLGREIQDGEKIGVIFREIEQRLSTDGNGN